jgi:hypothetical protein
MKIRFLVFFLLSIFIIGSCSLRIIEEKYFKSNDKKYIAKLSVIEGGLSNYNFHVNVSSITNKEKYIEVFSGNGLFIDVYWNDSNTLMIIQCDGNIKKIKSELRLNMNEAVIQVQVITASNLNINGKDHCFGS